MKIRWTKGSVRFRITPSELGTLLRGESLCEQLNIVSNTDVNGGWSVTLTGQSVDTRLTVLGVSLLCQVSTTDCERLAAPDAEGIYFQIYDGVCSPVAEVSTESNETTGQYPSLRWFIEKDFPCVHPRASKSAEPVTEVFAPPEGFEARKLPGC